VASKKIAVAPFLFAVAPGPAGRYTGGGGPGPGSGEAFAGKCGLTPHFVGSALEGLPQNAPFAGSSARFERALASANL